ncbi:MAG: hypothetical protein EOO38_07290 [Cytophagaceae bacterium]|nr:MAG: hypothetical protein EOO38_07290 [Cytophagaceae bacterium]
MRYAKARILIITTVLASQGALAVTQITKISNLDPHFREEIFQFVKSTENYSKREDIYTSDKVITYIGVKNSFQAVSMFYGREEAHDLSSNCAIALKQEGKINILQISVEKIIGYALPCTFTASFLLRDINGDGNIDIVLLQKMGHSFSHPINITVYGVFLSKLVAGIPSLCTSISASTLLTLSKARERQQILETAYQLWPSAIRKNLRLSDCDALP